MFINLTNQSSYAINNLGVYFGDSSTDTIKHCTIPLIYLNPQIESSVISTDTLGWTLIRGFYTANGTEKYIMLGNFRADEATDTLMVNPTNLPFKAANYFYDDVSCIDMDLPAFAGNDNSVVPGDSIYIGRESDVGIDEACMWYKLPLAITPATPALDTVAGMWVKPTATSTYVVRQDICGTVKWDTVVIYMNPVGIEKLKILNDDLRIYPIPANDFLELRISTKHLFKEFNSISIYNNLGQLIREEELKFEDISIKLKTGDLQNGIYSVQLKSGNSGTVSKRFVISH